MKQRPIAGTPLRSRTILIGPALANYIFIFLIAVAISNAFLALSSGGEILKLGSLDRPAAVMLGSSETTFYVISVYFGAAGISRSRWAVPAAVAADLACFISAAWAVKLIWG